MPRQAGLITYFCIGSIVVLEATALLTGHNGHYLPVTLVLCAGLAGYKLSDFFGR